MRLVPWPGAETIRGESFINRCILESYATNWGARCLAAGMGDYLSKSVLPKVLAEVVARWIGAPASISGSTGDYPLRIAPGGTAC
jgi:hypothetical protein